MKEKLLQRHLSAEASKLLTLHCKKHSDLSARAITPVNRPLRSSDQAPLNILLPSAHPSTLPKRPKKDTH